MNENKPNWVDKANLASNVVQNIQLQGVHSTLQALGDLQAQKIRLDLNELQVREREDRLRDHVWRMEHAFKSVLRDASTTPCAIYVLAKQVLDGMTRYRVTTATFREFNDKDRLGQFMHTLQQAIEDSIAKMSLEQQGDTEKFLRFQSESQELTDLVENLQAQNQQRTDKIERAKKRKGTAIAKLEGLGKKVGTPEAKVERLAAIGRCSLGKVGVVILGAPAGIAWLSLLFYLGVPIQAFFGDRNDPEDGKLFATGLGILLVAIALTAFAIILHRKSQFPRSIEEQIALREKEISDADATLAKLERFNPPAGDLKKFEAKDLSELTWLRNERDSFMLQFRQANQLSSDPFPENSRKQHAGAPGPAVLHEMSPEVQELARRADKKISAIKLYNEQSGVGLAEAKEAVEAFFEQVHSDD
jgi:hypothetical protein